MRSAMAVAGLWLAASFTVQANVVSDFSTGDEGWRSVTLAFPDPGAPPGILNTFTPLWLPTGGNPGGYIYNPDPNGNVQYWLAPSQFLGDQSAATALLFSLADSPLATIFTQADIILTGGGLTLTRQVPSVPNSSWTSYTIPLVAGSWTINSPSGAAASAADLQTALGSLTGLYIRGEFYLSNDTQYLDSVQLQTSAPEPASVTGVLLGLAAILAGARRKHRA